MSDGTASNAFGRRYIEGSSKEKDCDYHMKFCHLASFVSIWYTSLPRSELVEISRNMIVMNRMLYIETYRYMSAQAQSLTPINSCEEKFHEKCELV